MFVNRSGPYTVKHLFGANFAWLRVYICLHNTAIVSAPHLDEWVCGGKKTALVKQTLPHLSCNSTHVCSIFCSVPCRAFWRHVSESVLRLGVWDGNDVFVVWSYDFLCVCLLCEFPRARARVVGVGGHVEGGWGAECWVGDGEGWGESGFGAGDCRVVTLQEGVVDLGVFLLPGDKRLISSTVRDQLINSLWARRVQIWDFEHHRFYITADKTFYFLSISGIY